jgi:hypothetical protein
VTGAEDFDLVMTRSELEKIAGLAEGGNYYPDGTPVAYGTFGDVQLGWDFGGGLAPNSGGQQPGDRIYGGYNIDAMARAHGLPRPNLQTDPSRSVSLGEIQDFWTQAIVNPNAPGAGIIAGIEGAGMGFMAGLDGAVNVVPVVGFTPFESAGFYDSSQFGLGASQAVGGVTRDAALFLFGAAAWRSLPVLGGGNLSIQASLGLSAGGLTPLGVATSGTGAASLMSSFLFVNGGRISTATELIQYFDPDE